MKQEKCSSIQREHCSHDTGSMTSVGLPAPWLGIDMGVVFWH